MYISVLYVIHLSVFQIFLSVFYAASLTSLLASSEEGAPFSSLEGAMRDPQWRVAMYRDGAIYTSLVVRYLPL